MKDLLLLIPSPSFANDFADFAFRWFYGCLALSSKTFTIRSQYKDSALFLCYGLDLYIGSGKLKTFMIRLQWLFSALCFQLTFDRKHHLQLCINKKMYMNDELFWLELFMGGLGQVADRLVPKNSTRSLKHSKSTRICGHTFLSQPAHF